MSHTMNIKTEIRDKEALAVACERLGVRMKEGSFKFHEGLQTGEKETGIGVYLEGWEYPVVVKDNGTVAYDNYNGRWGNIDRLYGLMDVYALEKASMEARKQGYSLFETTDEQGNLQLRIRVGE